MNLIVIESPYAGDKEENIKYAIECMKDSLSRGESPYASHLLFTRFMNDDIPEERKMGIEAGFEWHSVADVVAVYVDLGISGGMIQGIFNAQMRNKPIVFRSIRNDD